jgi:hypothetical protein
MPRFEQPLPFLTCLLPAALITLGLVTVAERHFRLAPQALRIEAPPAASSASAQGLPSVRTVCTLD